LELEALREIQHLLQEAIHILMEQTVVLHLCVR
jgi:hypothetical protein